MKRLSTKPGKRRMALLLSILMMLSLLPVGAAALSEPNESVAFMINETGYWENQTYISTDVAPYIDNDRIMVPVAHASRALGAEVAWEAATKTVSVRQGEHLITMVIGSHELKKNGEHFMEMETPAMIRDLGNGLGRTMIPVSRLARALDVSYQWDPDTRTALFLPGSDRENSAVIFDEAGVYGPAAGSETIENDVIVRAEDVALQHMVITGSLTIEEGVGDGVVTLDSVVVEGNSYIQGGGVDSIYVNGGSYGSIIVQQTPSGAVRLVVTGQNRHNVKVDEAAEEQILILEGLYDKVIVNAPNVRVITRGQTEISHLVIAGTSINTTLETSEDTVIEEATVDGAGAVFEGGKATVKKISGTEKNSVDDRDDVVVKRTSGSGGSSSGSTAPAAPSGTAPHTASAAYFQFDSTTGTITKYFSRGQSGDLPEILYPIIPEVLGDNVPVKIIGEGAFDFGIEDEPNDAIPNKLTGVIFPDSLEHIADYAFRNNEIATLTLPEGVVSIGRESFRGNSLTGLVLPDSLDTLGVGSFRRNSIQTLTLSSSLETIRENAFRDNELTSLSVPPNVKTIEEAAFRGNRLASAELVAGLEVIGANAFENNLLENIIIPEGVTTLADGAFRVNRLSAVSIPESVTTIEPRIFYTNEFTEIPQFPSGITAIPQSMFGDNMLTGISMPDHITRIEGYAFIDNEITAITAADLNNVTYIGEMAFDHNQLSSLEFNSALEEIGHQAFSQNLLTSLTIPETLNKVETTAFWRNQLTEITIGDGVDIGNYALQENQLITITIGTGVTLGDSLLAGLFDSGVPANNLFKEAYLANGAGTYTGTQTGSWEKVPPWPDDDGYLYKESSYEDKWQDAVSTDQTARSKGHNHLYLYASNPLGAREIHFATREKVSLEGVTGIWVDWKNEGTADPKNKSFVGISSNQTPDLSGVSPLPLEKNGNFTRQTDAFSIDSAYNGPGAEYYIVVAARIEADTSASGATSVIHVYKVQLSYEEDIK